MTPAATLAWVMVVVLALAPLGVLVEARIPAPLTVTTRGQVVIDGEIYEDYELAELNPAMSNFLSVGKYVHDRLSENGYAYGTLSRVEASKLDKELAATRAEKAWFPMVLSISVVDEEHTSRYDAHLEFDPRKYAPPGLAVVAARISPDGSGKDEGEEEDFALAFASKLDIPLPEAPPFLLKHKKNIIGVFGVIIASAVVKIVRLLLERGIRRWKGETEDEDSSGTSVDAGVDTGAVVGDADAAASDDALSSSGGKKGGRGKAKGKKKDSKKTK